VILAKSECSHSLKPHKQLNPDIWVDASTSWGIGIIFGNAWYAWVLSPDCKSNGRDIGWAKSIALEMAVYILIDCNFTDCSVIIHGDNTSIIGTYEKGRSHNIPCNDSICQITSCIIPNNIMIIPIYVASALNRADPISHGTLGPSHLDVPLPLHSPQSLPDSYGMSRYIAEAHARAHTAVSGGLVPFIPPSLLLPEPSKRCPKLPPKLHDCIKPNQLHPHVLTSNCFTDWLTLYGITNFDAASLLFPTHPLIRCCLIMANSVLPSTLSNYSAGLIHFTKFCDNFNIPKEVCMPAPHFCPCSYPRVLLDL